MNPKLPLVLKIVYGCLALAIAFVALAGGFVAVAMAAPVLGHLPFISRSPLPARADCSPTHGSGGLKPGIYSTTVAGLQAIVVVGQGYDPAKPTYLAFHIHGDGGYYRDFTDPANPITRFVNQRGWVFFSPLSPNGDSWWDGWTPEYNRVLAGAFDEMLGRYNVCRNVLFGTVASGGSEFWTRFFFPYEGDKYPAHVVINCGGNDTQDSVLPVQLAAWGKDPALVARSTFYYVYGTTDRLVPGILRSIDLYRGAGFQVGVEAIQGAGHCSEWWSHDLPTYYDKTVTHWTELIAQLGIQ